MLSSVRHHLRHHARFYGSALLGVLAWAVADALAHPLRLVIGGDTFFGIYLLSTAAFATGATPHEIRGRASYADEGMILIVLITGVAIVISLASIFLLLNQEAPPDTLHFVLAVASVLLGWLSLHTIAAFRYAHIYYSRTPASEQHKDVGGLEFPHTEEPAIWDFLYYSFVVGMTAQVSDVQVATTRMRRLTLAHSIASFFFNTVLLALAVNVAAGGGRAH